MLKSSSQQLIFPSRALLDILAQALSLLGSETFKNTWSSIRKIEKMEIISVSFFKQLNVFI